MGVKESFYALMSGHPKDAFNYAFLPDDVITDARENDSQLLNNTQRLYADGLIDRQQFLSLYQKLSTNTLDDRLTKGMNTPADIAIGGTITDVGSAIKGLPSNLSSAIPWYIWLIAFTLVIVWAWPVIGPVVASLKVRGAKM